MNFKCSRKNDIYFARRAENAIWFVADLSDKTLGYRRSMIGLVKYWILVLVEAKCDNIEHAARLNASVFSLTNKSYK